MYVNVAWWCIGGSEKRGGRSGNGSGRSRGIETCLLGSSLDLCFGGLDGYSGGRHCGSRCGVVKSVYCLSEIVLYAMV